MTKKVLKAHADAFGDFKALVEAHARELTQYAAHMSLVKFQNGKPVGEVQPYPPPTTHPLISASIKQVSLPGGDTAFTPDYEIVDVLPVEPGTLRARQDELLQRVALMEQEAILKVLPRGKWRSHDIRFNDITKADNERAAAIEKARIEAKQDQVHFDEFTRQVVAGRPEHDHKFHGEHTARRERVEKIGRHAAKLASEVEDLTEANLHEWKPEPFPEG